ncbi:hypothetical protein BH11PLA2_BH11PLA2_41440 [soil metagenome]
MATESSLQVDREAALIIYQLGEAVVRFRWSIVNCYVRAAESINLEFDPIPPIWPVVDVALGSILDCNILLADDPSTFNDFAVRNEQYVKEAKIIRARLDQTWFNRDHQAMLLRINSGSKLAEPEEDIDDYIHSELIASPFAPPSWQTFLNELDRISACFRKPYREFFELSRLLSAVVYPLRNDCFINNPMRVYDVAYPIEDLSPRIRQHVRSIGFVTSLLSGIQERLDPASPYDSAVDLHKAILQRLKDAETKNDVVQDAVPAAVVQQKTGAVLPVIAPLEKLMIEPLGPEENIKDLLDLKSNMDPHDTYIGQSLPILRLFRRIREINLMPDEPLVILGPSGSGKTHLARLIHSTSNRIK